MPVEEKLEGKGRQEINHKPAFEIILPDDLGPVAFVAGSEIQRQIEEEQNVDVKSSAVDLTDLVAHGRV